MPIPSNPRQAPHYAPPTVPSDPHITITQNHVGPPAPAAAAPPVIEAQAMPPMPPGPPWRHTRILPFKHQRYALPGTHWLDPPYSWMRPPWPYPRAPWAFETESRAPGTGLIWGKARPISPPCPPPTCWNPCWYPTQAQFNAPEQVLARKGYPAAPYGRA